jgi:hypothetical protein
MWAVKLMYMVHCIDDNLNLTSSPLIVAGEFLLSTNIYLNLTLTHQKVTMILNIPQIQRTRSACHHRQCLHRPVFLEAVAAFAVAHFGDTLL